MIRRTPLRSRRREKTPRVPRPGHPLDFGPGWKKLCQAILTRDRYTCRYCGVERATVVVDHILPRRLFSSIRTANTKANLSALCPRHHGEKGRVENWLFQGEPWKLYEWIDVLRRTGPVPGARLKAMAWKRLKELLETK